MVMDVLSVAGLELDDPMRVAISDRSSAGELLISSRLPQVYERKCVKHIQRNIQSAIKRKLTEEESSLLWSMASARTEMEFNALHGAFETLNEDACRYLGTIDTSEWAAYMVLKGGRGTFQRHTSNPAEQAAKCLLPARWDLSILESMKTVGEWQARQLQLHQKALVEYDKYSEFIIPQLVGKLECFAMECDYYRVEKLDYQQPIYRVSDESRSSLLDPWFEVNLLTKHCDCLGWLDMGYPCVHAIVVWVRQRAALAHHWKDQDAFYRHSVESLYTMASFRQALDLAGPFTVPTLSTLTASVTIEPRSSGAAAAPRRGRPSKQARLHSVGEKFPGKQ